MSPAPLRHKACFAMLVAALWPTTLIAAGATAGPPDDVWPRLLALRTETDVPTLLDGLRDPSDAIRMRAATRLAVLGPDVGHQAPALIAALESDPDPVVRFSCAEALGRFVSDPAVAMPALEKALEDSARDVRYAAAHGISLFGDVGFLALGRIVQHGDSTTRVTALVAMGNSANNPANAALHPDAEILEMIFGLVSHPREKADVDLGAYILRGLRVDALRAVPLLRDALVRTPDHGMGESEIVAALQAYGAGPDPTPPRTAASLTVNEYREWASPRPGARAESIRTRLRSSDEYVVRYALADLRNIGPEDSLWCPELADVLSSRAGVYAVEPICAIGTACVPRLLGHLTGANYFAALWTLRVLETIGADGHEVTPAVLTALSSTRGDVQCAALRALARVSPRDAQAAILERTGHKTPPGVRREALLLVPVVFADRAQGLALLAGTLRNSSGDARLAAIEACGEYGAEATALVPELARLCRYEDTAATAVEALARIGDAWRAELPAMTRAFRVVIHSDERTIRRRLTHLGWNPGSRRVGRVLLSVSPNSAIPGIEKMLSSDLQGLASMGADLVRHGSVSSPRIRTLLLEKMRTRGPEERWYYVQALLVQRPLDREIFRALVEGSAGLSGGHLDSWGQYLVREAPRSEALLAELTRGVNSERRDVRRASAAALRSLGNFGAPATADLERAAREAPEQDRLAFLWALDAVDPPFDFLRHAIESANPNRERRGAP